MSLKDIFCQDRGIGALQRAYSGGRLAHAYIFAGADGVGKFTTAREWAKMLLCHDRKQEKGSDPFNFSDSCGVCESCRVFDGGGHPDFKVVYKELFQFTREGKGKTASVYMRKAVIDEFLIQKVSSRPQMGNSVVFVVREAEKLNASSQNALLKVLEEPPKHCFIILLCSRVDKLLPTTQSRCQIMRFGPVDEDFIVERLSKMGVSGTEAKYWAGFSEGSLGEAIDWAGLELKEGSCYQIKKGIVEAISKHKLSGSLDLADRMVKAAKRISEAWAAKEPDTSKSDINRRAQKGLLRMVIAAFCDAMKINAGDGVGLINSEQESQIRLLAGRFDAEAAAVKVSKAYESIRWVEASVNEKLIFDELLLNLTESDILLGSTA